MEKQLIAAMLMKKRQAVPNVLAILNPDDLLSLLKLLCSDKSQAPVVCLDYLQIVTTSKDFANSPISQRLVPIFLRIFNQNENKSIWYSEK